MSTDPSGRYTEHINTITRDIYYIDPEFFRMQYIVDGIIDDLAYTIGVNRTALNVVCPAECSSTTALRRRAADIVHDFLGSSSKRAGDRRLSADPWLPHFDRCAVCHRGQSDSSHRGRRRDRHFTGPLGTRH
jgi:hypothetical protein